MGPHLTSYTLSPHECTATSASATALTFELDFHLLVITYLWKYSAHIVERNLNRNVKLNTALWIYHRKCLQLASSQAECTDCKQIYLGFQSSWPIKFLTTLTRNKEQLLWQKSSMFFILQRRCSSMETTAAPKRQVTWFELTVQH